MEKYQAGLLRSIAAASGTDATPMDLDEGIDFMLTHRSGEHTLEAARLEVQLKATKRRPGVSGLSVQLERKRYDYLRSVDPAISKVLIVMSVPDDQNDWLHATNKRTRLHHAAYWVNLEGLPAVSAKKPTVSAPISQRFDDIVLCEIMERIGKGGKP